MLLPEEHREELLRKVIEGCAEMRALHEQIDREWGSASDEVWRDAGNQPVAVKRVDTALQIAAGPTRP